MNNLNNLNSNGLMNKNFTSTINISNNNNLPLPKTKQITK